MESQTQENAPAREDQRTDAAPVRPGRSPDVIRVGVARVPAFSLTRTRRWPGT
jgi:hypothetical protein